MNSSYMPVAILVAVVAIAYSISRDTTETSSSQAAQASAQANQQGHAGTGGAPSREGGYAAQASTQKGSSDERPIDQAWETVKEEFKEGREDLVDAFTGEENQQGPVDKAWDNVKDAGHQVANAFTDDESDKGASRSASNE